MSELQSRSRENNNNSHLWNRNDHGEYRKCKLFSSLADFFSFCKENGQKGKFPRKTSRGKENRLSRCENVIHKRKILLEKYLGMLYNNDK